ncbi:MAG: hypothetical protein HKN39_06510 [Flavobacteriales bacterium]|nr:hypothetical protein [Flavobacteriales bacterium]
MKTLFINRHAKSSWKNHSLRDFDRPLNKRGKINAPFMAERFAQNETIDFIISSPAERAKKTAMAFQEACAISEEQFRFEQDIYMASVSEILRIVNSIPDKYNSVMLFGHNPTFSELAWYFDHNFNDHLVTCARVKVEFDLDRWSLIGKNLGRVVDHDYPRKYKEMENL